MYRILWQEDGEFLWVRERGLEEGKGGRTYGISYSERRSEDLRRLLEVKRLVGGSDPMILNLNPRVFGARRDPHTCWLLNIG